MTRRAGNGPGAGTTIGVVGTGNMGAALVKGWLRAASPGVELLVWDKVEAAARRLLTADCISAAASLEGLLARADVVLVVVKPKDATEVLGAIAGLVREGQVVVSAMSGLTLGWMRGVLGPGPVLVRIMPNLAVELGAGAVAFASEPAAPEAAVSAVRALFQPLGLVEVVEESLFDAVTAVSGSGPAFLALAVEGLEDGAVAAGLSRSVARTVVRQCMLDTARLLSQHSDSPADLSEYLISAGGGDPAALGLLEDRQVRSAYREAVGAAMERSRQMRKA